MRIASVLSAWTKGHVASNGTLTCVAGKLYSYQECIAYHDHRFDVVYMYRPYRTSKTTRVHATRAKDHAERHGARVIGFKEVLL